MTILNAFPLHNCPKIMKEVESVGEILQTTLSLSEEVGGGDSPSISQETECCRFLHSGWFAFPWPPFDKSMIRIFMNEYSKSILYGH